jgi:hypothetical protein
MQRWREEMSEDANRWNGPERAKFGLEIAKLLVGIWVAWWVWHLGDTATRARDAEVAKRDDQARVDAQIKAVVDQRLKLWEKVSPGMNEIYCYFVEVGNWKNLDGEKILARKRELDALMYSNKIMWDPAFFKTYETFMSATFTPFRDQGLNAALRTTRRGRPEGPIKGVDFDEQGMNAGEVFDAYWAFQKTAANELNVDIHALHLDIPEVPDRDKTLKESGPAAQ